MTEHMGTLLHSAEHTEGAPPTVAIADMMMVGTHLAEYTLLDLGFRQCMYHGPSCTSLRCL